MKNLKKTNVYIMLQDQRLYKNSSHFLNSKRMTLPLLHSVINTF